MQALIDWDGVAAVPRIVGNERYTSWLTLDWGPAMYGWNELMEKEIKQGTLWEDSLDTLALHRNEYNDFMQQFLSARQTSVSLSPTVHSGGDPLVHACDPRNLCQGNCQVGSEESEAIGYNGKRSQ